MMKIVFSIYAVRELNDAASFYEKALVGLGKRFRQEVKKAVATIAILPTAWPIADDDVRKYVLHSFPYNILYSIENDHIFIIAIAHQRRQPRYWLERDTI